MKEKLIIKNFGPIKEVELELGKFNVLIGEQATGKSTVAKLLIAIGNTCYREIFDLNQEENLDKQTSQFLSHLNLVGILSYLYNNTEIYFEGLKYKLTYRNQKVNFSVAKDDFSSSLSYDFTYIPSERSLAIILLDSLYALIETKAALPQLFLRFGNKFQTARKFIERFNYKNIIGVNYQFKNNSDIIVLQNGKEIPIRDSSSGIQSSIALLTVFDYVLQGEKKEAGNLLVIEEPELNCFPKTQYELVKHFVNNYSCSYPIKVKNQLLITTHSPYILTSLNNLMYAYQIGQNNKEETNKIIEEKYWVNPDDVSAYRLMTDGTAKNILDTALKQIDAGELDEVSRSINEEWDQISDIKFSAVNAH